MSPTINSGELNSRSLSALFDTKAEADSAVRALEAAGIADVVLTGADNQGYGTALRDNGAGEVDERGFFETIGDFFFPDEDRYTYAEALDRGGFLVTVDNVPAHQHEHALDILDASGAVDLDAREAEWRTEGWDPQGHLRDEGLPGTVISRAADRAVDAVTPDVGTDEALADSAPGRRTDPLYANGSYDEAGLTEGGKIDIVEESISVRKREQDLGRVRVRSYVKEIPVEESVNLRKETVSIDRRPVDRPATEDAFRDRSIEAHEYAEEAVVSKEARVVEEVGLHREQTVRDEVVRDTVRKTEVEILDERDRN